MSMYWDNVNEVSRLILTFKKTWRGVTLPSPQTAGTWTQKWTYAQMKEQQIVQAWMKEQS